MISFLLSLKNQVLHYLCMCESLEYYYQFHEKNMVAITYCLIKKNSMEDEINACLDSIEYMEKIF